MKVELIQINWHGKLPIYTIEFISKDTLMTGGSDANVRFWEIQNDPEKNATKVNFISELTNHSSTTTTITLIIYN